MDDVEGCKRVVGKVENGSSTRTHRTGDDSAGAWLGYSMVVRDGFCCTRAVLVRRGEHVVSEAEATRKARQGQRPMKISFPLGDAVEHAL
ncbi:hypothetical protein V6N13_048580 [Hibiscus sabdariffa]